MKTCKPFQDFGGNKFYVPTGDGRLLGSGANGNPCSFKPTTTSSGYSNGWANSISNYSSPIQKLDEAMRKLPESTPYVRPEFVPYTPPVKSFLEEPKYVIPIPQSNTSIVSGNSKKANDLNQFLHTKYIPQDVIGKGGNTVKIYNGTHSEETMKVINFIQTQSYNKGWGSSALYHGPGGIEGSYRATVINLAYTDMYDLDLCNLGVLLRDYNLELDSILLQGNKLTAKHIPELISGITSVRHQTICEYVGRSKVFKEWHGHLTVQHVKYLNISNNQIGDEGASIFAEAIRTGRFTHLKSLNLADNNITDIGAKVLADSLTTGNYNSKILHLEGNKITDEGVSYYLDNLKKDQLNSTYVSFTAPKSTIDKIMVFFGKGARYYVNEFHKNQQSSKEADIAVNGKDGFGHCVQVVRTAGIDFASAMAQKAIAAPPIVKKAMEQGHPYVKLIVGGALVGSALNDMKGAFLSEDFAHCMAWMNGRPEEVVTIGQTDENHE